MRKLRRDVEQTAADGKRTKAELDDLKRVFGVWLLCDLAGTGASPQRQCAAYLIARAQSIVTPPDVIGSVAHSMAESNTNVRVRVRRDWPVSPWCRDVARLASAIDRLFAAAAAEVCLFCAQRPGSAGEVVINLLNGTTPYPCHHCTRSLSPCIARDHASVSYRPTTREGARGLDILASCGSQARTAKQPPRRAHRRRSASMHVSSGEFRGTGGGLHAVAHR
jgi:hypothetical protein